MKTPNFKITILLLFAFASGFAQVGIGNTNPKATLDVTATNPTGTSTSVDGITLPSVTRQRAQSMTAANISASTMIYVNEVVTGTATGITANVTTVGIYYWDGSLWQSVKGTSTSGKSTTTELSLYITDIDANDAVNLGIYSVYTTGWTTGTAMAKRYVGSYSTGAYHSSTTSATSLTGISLNGWLSNISGSNSTATIYIMKYSLGTTSGSYATTVTGTSLGSQVISINSGIIAPVSINIGSTSLAAGDVIICMLLNGNNNNRAYEFSGQLVMTQ